MMPFAFDAPIVTDRLGTREEAYFVKDVMFKGEWGDTGIYAILADEWAQRNGHCGMGTAQWSERMTDVP